MGPGQVEAVWQGSGDGIAFTEGAVVQNVRITRIFAEEGFPLSPPLFQ